MATLDPSTLAMVGTAAARAWTGPTGNSKWGTPGELARNLDPRTVQTPALDLIDKALTELLDTRDGRLIISMPPQEGKSQRASRRFPTWALTQNPNLRIAIASYEHGVARRWGRAIRDDITQHQAELGLRVSDKVSAQNEWQLAKTEGGVYTAGIGGSLTGRPVDLLIVDDPVKDRVQANSETFRENVWNWWTDVAATRLAPGAPVVVILTRWHHDDLAGRLLAAADGDTWKVLNIPARALEGESDPLKREPGEFMKSARGRTLRDWQKKELAVGPRTWASLYQGRPNPEASGIFPTEWPRYSHPLWTEHPDGHRTVYGDFTRLIQSWDLAFKDTKTSDYVVGQVWGLANGRAYLLDQTRARIDFTATCEAILATTARWPQATGVFVEDKANGPAVIRSLQTRIPGLVPVEPDGGKYARAVAVQPFTASGAVILPDPGVLPNVQDLVEEAKAFPAGKHDDAVDALTQALGQLFLQPILTDDGLVSADDLLELHMTDFGDY